MLTIIRKLTSPIRVLTILRKVTFRFTFCYLLSTAIAMYAVLNNVPLVGHWVQHLIEPVWQHSAEWLALHVFHVVGIATQDHSSDSRDSALAWITIGFLIAVSLLMSLVWTAFDRGRENDAPAAAWLRYIMRMVLIVLMLRYAFIKIFPLQMPPPSLAVLNEPLGSTSPLTLLWTLVGLHPGYEMFCGAMEGLCAILLIFRRTALLGALLSIFMMSNVLLDNLFFDVPVKLGAAHLLLYAVYLAVPDLKTLYQFFWRHQPVALISAWAPSTKRNATRIATAAGACVFVLSFLIQFVPGCYSQWSTQRAMLNNPSPLTGEWKVDPSLRSRSVLTGEGRPMQTLYLEPNGTVMVRSSDGRLWRAFASLDLKKHDFVLGAGNFDGERFDASYHFTQPDPLHLVLNPIRDSLATNDTLFLTKVALPTSYPLLERKFHWVNEWGFWR